MIYLDNAATTSVCKSAILKMQEMLAEEYGNPSAMYGFATNARREMNIARKKIACMINAAPDEIYFTSGGTESDNWALSCLQKEITKDKKKHIITTSIEHHAILNTCEHLEKNGYDITYINPDSEGIVSPEHIEKAIRKDETIIISVMFANNEIGTIQRIKDIGEIAKKYRITFHTDAVQAFGHIDIDVKEMNIDMLSASSHKCNGPKGTGILYVRNGVKLYPLIHGGGQERKKRAGTENVPAIAGFGAACDECMKKNHYNMAYIMSLRNHFASRLKNEIKDCRINGSMENRLPGNVNVSFAYIDGEALQIQLDLHDICCSTSSACNAGNKQLSHVIKAINTPDEYGFGTVRFTLSDENTLEEIDKTVDITKEVVEKLRKMSPHYN